ncbi:MAG: PqqD family protein [Bacteroidaceae bacterium]|nr:PqqD family protein [Bacteroidaceae bacterium]
MKIKSGFELRTVCGENILISHGRENLNFTKIISLNESAAFIWNNVVDKEFTLEDMCKLLMSEYEVDEQTARKDCEELVKSWKDVGFIE